MKGPEERPMRLDRALVLLGLVVATGIGMIWAESQNLRLRQKLSELHRRREVLAEEQARLRLAVSRFSAPASVMQNLESAEEKLNR
jgi:cell division protein FtsL